MSNEHGTEKRNGGVSGEELAVSDFVIGTQFRLHQLVKASGITQAGLAERMGMSKSRVSAIFGCDSNLTLRTIGKLLYALGESNAQLRSPAIDARMAVLGDCSPDEDLVPLPVVDVVEPALRTPPDSNRSRFSKALFANTGRAFMDWAVTSAPVSDRWGVTNDNLCEDVSMDLKAMGY